MRNTPDYSYNIVLLLGGVFCINCIKKCLFAYFNKEYGFSLILDVLLFGVRLFYFKNITYNLINLEEVQTYIILGITKVLLQSKYATL